MSSWTPELVTQVFHAAFARSPEREGLAEVLDVIGWCERILGPKSPHYTALRLRARRRARPVGA